MMQNFSYDPFDPAVMADPLPYYRVLRDEHPVYYIDKWDTYALSRFDDIWQVLASQRRHLRRVRGNAARRNGSGASTTTGRCPIRRCTRCRSTRTSTRRSTTSVRRCTSGPVPAEVGGHAGRPDPRPGQRATRRTVAARHASTSPRTTAASSRPRWSANWSDCQPISRPTCWPPSTRAAWPQPGSGVEVANARPGYLEYLVPIIERTAGRGRRRRDAADRRQPLGYRLPDGSALSDMEAAVQMLGVFIGGTETVPKIVAHGLWELGRRPDQMAAVRADLGRQRSGRTRGDDPLLRAGAMVCAHAAQAVHHPRHDDRIRASGSSRCSASANRDEREYPDPDEFVWNRPIERLLAFGRGQHFCLGVHLARLEIAIMVTEWLKRVPDLRIISEAAAPPAVEFPVGLEQYPVSPGGGRLTCGPTGSSRRTPLSDLDSRTRPPTTLADGQVLLRFMAAGVCGSDLPAVPGRARQDRRRHRSECRRDGGLPDPRGRRRSDREPSSRATGWVTGSSAGRRVSTV